MLNKRKLERLYIMFFLHNPVTKMIPLIPKKIMECIALHDRMVK
jgi:hypothetical protein